MRLLSKSLFICLFAGWGTQARSFDLNILAADLGVQIGQQASMNVEALNIIDWKVGDTSTMKIKISVLPLPMQLIKSVTKDEGETLWFRQELKGFLPQTTYIQIRKADGQVLKIIQNGKEQALPSTDDVEIISQDVEDITVPAGKFKTLKVVGKNKDGDFTVWLNPTALPVGGDAKMEVVSQGQKVSGELVSFKKN